MTETKTRVQISKLDLLKAFRKNDDIPDMMKNEMLEVQPLTHLLSTYVIKPIAMEKDPYILPRAAAFVKYGGAN